MIYVIVRAGSARIVACRLLAVEFVLHHRMSVPPRKGNLTVRLFVCSSSGPSFLQKRTRSPSIRTSELFSRNICTPYSKAMRWRKSFKLSSICMC